MNPPRTHLLSAKGSRYVTDLQRARTRLEIELDRIADKINTETQSGGDLITWTVCTFIDMDKPFIQEVRAALESLGYEVKVSLGSLIISW